jgi:hypothetical protein
VGFVTEYFQNLIAKQVDDSGLVVWDDPDGAYAQAVDAFEMPETKIFRYEGSFVDLRSRIDRKKLMDGEVPPRTGDWGQVARRSRQVVQSAVRAGGARGERGDRSGAGVARDPRLGKPSPLPSSPMVKMSGATRPAELGNHRHCHRPPGQGCCEGTGMLRRGLPSTQPDGSRYTGVSVR